MNEEKYPFFNSIAILLALIVAFYGLIAQWRKAPYMVNSMYKLALEGLKVLLTGTAIIFLMTFFKDELMYYLKDKKILGYEFKIDQIIETVNIVIAIYISFYTYIVVKKDYNKYFLMNKENKKTSKKSYLKANPDFIKIIMKKFFLMTDKSDWNFLKSIHSNNYSLTVFCQIEGNARFNSDIYGLALDFIEKDAFVQYTSCDRHPVEFINGLKEQFITKHKDIVKKSKEDNLSTTVSNQVYIDEREWLEKYEPIWSGFQKNHSGNNIDYKSKLILIDAHTVHFGFDEDVYDDMKSKAEKSCLEVVKSDTSYPGIHEAIKEGFRKLIEKNGENKNLALMLYENVSSLIDIESPEQFRIFMRHVAASERIMGGMFTVFYENNISIENSNFVRSIVDKYFIFMKDKDIAYSEEDINKAIQKIKPDILKWITEQTENNELIILTVLNGGAEFANDLIKSLVIYENIPNKDRVHFENIRLSLYKDQTKISDSDASPVYTGKSLRGKSVLVIDDICHTGSTLKKIINFLEKKGAKKNSVESIVAIHRSEEKFSPRWFLFKYNDKYSEYPEAWLYGYGMDLENDESSRKLPYFIFARRHG